MSVQPAQRKWLMRCLLGVVVTNIVLVGRLYHLQVTRSPELSQKASKNWERRLVRESRRGEIRDARGVLLAVSKPVRTVCADPSVIGTNGWEVARVLAPLLRMDTAELAAKLTPTTTTNEHGKVVTDKYVVLKRKVEVEVWNQISSNLASLRFAAEAERLPRKTRNELQRIRTSSLMTEPDQERLYPNGTMAAHTLGYVGMGQPQPGMGQSLLTVGKAGLELMLDEVLRGAPGWRTTETDSRRREVVAGRDQNVAPREGLDAHLTIDGGIQHILETELAGAMERHSPVSVSAAVMRPKTGEILAIANLPTYSPNDPGASLPEERRNRFVTDLSEPGSTFKAMVISGALNDNLLHLQDSFDCENGRFLFAGRYLNDAHPYGVLTVERIVSKSSNIGAAKIGMRLGPERLYGYVRGFGFGSRTGILLPGEPAGIVHPVERWSKLSISRIPMGHEVAVTPLQTLMAMSAIANKGLLMRPLLLDRLTDRQGKVVWHNQPEAVRQVVSPAAAREMVQALKAVVSTNGTAAKARMTYYTVAGKTGTAQKPINGQYVRGKFFSSFIGFFPADNPELCISVVFDEPKRGYFGSETAVPVFLRIAERAANYLAIPPDRVPTEAFAVTGLGPGRR